MENILINKLQTILKGKQGNVDYAIATVLIKYLDIIKTKTIIEVAKESNCAKASVVKFAKRLGLDGYKELIQRLNMEASILVPQLTIASGLEMQPENMLLNKYGRLISQNLEYIQNNFQSQIIDAVNLIKTSQKVYLFGKGANLSALQIFNNYLMKLEYWSNFAMDWDIQKHLVENVNENDVCFIFSYSGITPEILEVYDHLKFKKPKIVFVTSNNLSPMYDETNTNIFVLKNEEVQREQRNTLLSILFIIMQMVYLLSNK